MNVDDPYCEEVMELSALPFLSCFFLHSLSPSTCLCHISSLKENYWLLSTCLCFLLTLLCISKYGCRVAEKEGCRWKKKCGSIEVRSLCSSSIFSFLRTPREINSWTELQRLFEVVIYTVLYFWHAKTLTGSANNAVTLQLALTCHSQIYLK